MSSLASPFESSSIEVSRPLQTSQASQVSWLRNLIWLTPLIAVTFLSKLSVPPLGARGIGIALPLIIAVTLLGCLGLQFRFSTGRLTFCALMLGILGMTQIMKSDSYAPSSLLLLTALHLPYVLQLHGPMQRNGTTDLCRVLDIFLTICLLCAVLGIAQFALQPFVASKWLFPIENFVPDSFLVQNYNDQAPLEYGSKVFRANGLFLLEPSYLSQLLAIALVTEMCTRNRWWHMLVYLAGMVVSYSGTGLIVLGICIPLAAMLQRRFGILLALLIVAMVALTLGQYLYLEQFVSRVHEFNSTGSSAFARFVGGFYLFDQFLWRDAVHALLGIGAGMFKEYAPMGHYPAAEMPLFKMILEFGVFGALLYFSFMVYCLSKAALPAPARLAIGLTFLLNGLYVPFSHAIALSLLMWPATLAANQQTEMPTSSSPSHSNEVSP